MIFWQSHRIDFWLARFGSVLVWCWFVSGSFGFGSVCFRFDSGSAQFDFDLVWVRFGSGSGSARFAFGSVWFRFGVLSVRFSFGFELETCTLAYKSCCIFLILESCEWFPRTSTRPLVPPGYIPGSALAPWHTPFRW